MARKQVHIQAVGGHSPRERAWAAMRQLRVFTAYTLARASKNDDETVASYIQCLVRAGFVDFKEAPPGPDGKYDQWHYTLVRDVGIHAPRLRRDGAVVTQGSGREQMWRTLRIIPGDFTARDLAHQASTDAVLVDIEDVRFYLRYLERAGYIQLVAKGGPGRLARYRFIRARNTGAKAPMIQRVRHVYDPNIGKVVWAPLPEEVADEC